MKAPIRTCLRQFWLISCITMHVQTDVPATVTTPGQELALAAHVLARNFERGTSEVLRGGRRLFSCDTVGEVSKSGTQFYSLTCAARRNGMFVPGSLR